MRWSEESLRRHTLEDFDDVIKDEDWVPESKIIAVWTGFLWVLAIIGLTVLLYGVGK